MSVGTGLTHRAIDPEDLLSRARTIRADNASTCSLNENWLAPSVFLTWSRRGLTEADDYGLANAVTYAKRAACCRIDRLLRNYHLSRLHREPFPPKIEVLMEIGIRIPSVVQELIIDPRNELEHRYVAADVDVARHAVEIAELFLSATDDEENCEAIIALNPNILYGHSVSEHRDLVTFNGWSGTPMLFIDVFGDPNAAKIVDGENGEVLYTDLGQFTRQQCIQLARVLNSHRGTSGESRFFYTELKRQAGF